MSEYILTERPRRQKSDWYQWYVVGICTAAYVLSFVDRQILALMIEPIKHDLHITDTQFSLLNGLAFSLLYSFMGLPVAALADRRSRPLIITIGMAVWSFATALSGLSRGFVHMFLARIGVGVGEASLSPSAYSMFGDMIPKQRLGRAAGVYSLGSFVGASGAFFLGGWVISLLARVHSVSLPLVGQVYAWQLTFLVVGLPGLLLALVLFLTVRDPQRRGSKHGGDGAEDKPGFPNVLTFLKRHRQTFSCHYLGFSCYAIVVLGLLAWTPAFYIRTFGLTATQAGYALGTVVLVANGGGVLFGGWLMDRLTRRGHTDAGMRAGFIGMLGMIIPVIAFAHVGNLWASLALLALGMFFGSIPMPASTAALQVLSPGRMRAQLTAIFMLISNLAALGVGTTLVAVVTDQVFGSARMVGSSLSLVYGVASLAAVLLLWRGCRHFRDSAEREGRSDSERSSSPVEPVTDGAADARA